MCMKYGKLIFCKNCQYWIRTESEYKYRLMWGECKNDETRRILREPIVSETNYCDRFRKKED